MLCRREKPKTHSLQTPLALTKLTGTPLPLFQSQSPPTMMILFFLFQGHYGEPGELAMTPLSHFCPSLSTAQQICQVLSILTVISALPIFGYHYHSSSRHYSLPKP